jgi:ADP-ribosylglycohydrolase
VKNHFEEDAEETSLPSPESIIGCLLGTAVGDCVGLRHEGLSKHRQRKICPKISGPDLILGRGMISDDTEQTCMVAQALIVSAGNAEIFAQSLAGQFRLWLLSLPASVGYATLRATMRLWLGYPYHRSGVFSAGNGPAMRSAILGVCYGHDTERLRTLVTASTRITHTDPKAEYGALAVAVAAHLAASQPHTDIAPERYTRALLDVLPTEAGDLIQLIGKVVESVKAGRTTESFAEQLGLRAGVTGYVYHTVPVALHAWLGNQQDYRSAVIDIVRCGGDTDTTAAVVGGIIGARVGKAGIPDQWLAALWEWPRTLQWIEELGQRVANVVARGACQAALPLPLTGTFLRNIVFSLLVLGHGFRRLLPPY